MVKGASIDRNASGREGREGRQQSDFRDGRAGELFVG